MKIKSEKEEGQKPRRRTREEVAAVVKEYRASHLTQAEFAQKSGMKLSCLRNWIYCRGQTGTSAVGFAEVEVRGAPGTGVNGAKVTIRWPNGVEAEVVVGRGNDAQAIGLIRGVVA